MVTTVAVVDDDRDILDAVRLVLEGEGWQVLTYAGGEDFLNNLQSHRIDCLILDPHMPGLSGAEVAHSDQFRRMCIPFIGLTAQPYSITALDLRNAGAKVVLTKPVMADELIRQIRFAVDDDEQGVSKELEEERS